MNFFMKQAYLIEAHRPDLTFKTLIQMLDNIKNDIYIHMDANNESYSPDEIIKLVKFSKVFHAPRVKVSWAAFSQVEAELLLLETALNNGHYDHYHLISGQDLPIKTQKYIINFFESHPGVEFVSFSPEYLIQKGMYCRQYYFFFQEILGHNRYSKTFRSVINNLTAGLANSALLNLQKLFHLKRNQDLNLRSGSNWFSITDELARYILSKRYWIRDRFNHTFCPDEAFLQTMLINTDFMSRIFQRDNNLRLVDWSRGEPYIFTINDLDELKESEMLFARKFDPVKDEQIILKIQELYS